MLQKYGAYTLPLNVHPPAFCFPIHLRWVPLDMQKQKVHPNHLPFVSMLTSFQLVDDPIPPSCINTAASIALSTNLSIPSAMPLNNDNPLIKVKTFILVDI
jgi:hypothetical protein